MVCPRCGHHMTNEEANFCGRCGGPLRAGAILPVDDEDEIGQPAIGVIPEQPGPPPTPPRLQQAGDDPLGPASLDLDAIDVLPRRGEQPLLQRPIIAPSWQEPFPLMPLSVDAPTAFEAVLPSLDEQIDADATGMERIATRDLGELPPDAPTAEEPVTTPVAARAATAGGDRLRVGGCTIHVSDDPTPLVEVRLRPGAVLSIAAEALVWMQEQVALSTLRLVPDGAGDPAFEAAATYLQAVGPGELALAGEKAATVTPLELRPGAVLGLADGAALAWTRGVRARRIGRPGDFPAMRLTADRPALILVRCPGDVQYLDLGPGDRLTVSPRALLAATGTVDCTRLCCHRAGAAPLVDYRLIGPGRVVLGAHALPGTGV